jgi:hypothetical protein
MCAWIDGLFDYSIHAACRELDNHIVDALQKLLRIAFHSYGLPRNPRCQGLVERCNRTVKRSLIKKCQDNGYTQAGEDFKWHKYLDEVTAHENSNITRLYGIAPFVCLRHRPFSSSGITRELTPLDVSIMYAKMAALQRCSRDKIAHRGHQDYHIGERVRVKAGQSLKRAHAIALYSATGVVDSYSPSGTSFVRLRWETAGLSGERPGELSKRMYFIGRLRKVNAAILHVQIVTIADVEGLSTPGSSRGSGQRGRQRWGQRSGQRRRGGRRRQRGQRQRGLGVSGITGKRAGERQCRTGGCSVLLVYVCVLRGLCFEARDV